MRFGVSAAVKIEITVLWAAVPRNLISISISRKTLPLPIGSALTKNVNTYVLCTRYHILIDGTIFGVIYNILALQAFYSVS
jgi:hypothetical protein